MYARLRCVFRQAAPPRRIAFVMNATTSVVGASLDVMDRDARKMRNERPFVFSNLKTGQGVDTIVKFIETEGML